jgi:hypothetical protein
MSTRAVPPERTPGAKMMYLIKRRPTTSREELVAHWFANHMPLVIRAQRDQALSGKAHARRYIATLFQPDRQGEHPWDGIAQLWWDKPLPRPREPHGAQPTDTFQQKVEPYLPWATTEYVAIDPSAHLAVEPLTLNAPFPCTRSGFFKVSFLVKAKPDTDFGRFFDHWLRVHVPNVASTMDRVGGFGYAVSQSIEPQIEPYAGLAELYFQDGDGWTRYKAAIRPDGMEEWVDPSGTLVLRANTEMIGIP